MTRIRFDNSRRICEVYQNIESVQYELEPRSVILHFDPRFLEKIYLFSKKILTIVGKSTEYYQMVTLRYDHYRRQLGVTSIANLELNEKYIAVGFDDGLV